MAIPWYVLLALSGEYIPMPAGGETPSQASHPAGYKRFQRRVGSLKDAGYLASGRREAEAGDTVELVGVKRGSRWEPAGIIVRASAAYVAGVKAAQNPKNWTVIPADQVLGDPQIPDDERPP